MVGRYLEEVCCALARGESVKLSSFGTFSVRQKIAAHGPQSEDRSRSGRSRPGRVLRVSGRAMCFKAVINGEMPELQLAGE